MDLLHQLKDIKPNVEIVDYYFYAFIVACLILVALLIFFVFKFLKKEKLCTSIRGLRDQKDFSFELNLNYANKTQYNKFETFFVIPDKKHLLTSSSLVRELLKHNGDISSYLPKRICKLLKD